MSRGRVKVDQDSLSYRDSPDDKYYNERVIVRYGFQSQRFDDLQSTYSLLFRAIRNKQEENLKGYGNLPVPEWLSIKYDLKKYDKTAGQRRPTMWDFVKPDRTLFLTSNIQCHIECLKDKIQPIQTFEQYGEWEDRLRQLKAYMDGRKPRGLKALWQDKRDTLQWYTFWAVAIVGGTTLILTILGLGVSIAQVVGTFTH